MSLNDSILSHANSYFLDDEMFAEDVVFYPAGVAASKVTIKAVVDSSALIGSREQYGDGVVLDKLQGRTERESILLEVSKSVGVQETQDANRPDIFEWDSKFWAAQRVTGQDSGMLSILCTRRENVRTRSPR